MNANMSAGLFLYDNGHQQMYLPIFCADRELVHAVFLDAMREWSGMDHVSKSDPITFYKIANRLGMERYVCEGCFMGPEAVREYEDAEFVIGVDFREKRVLWAR